MGWLDRPLRHIPGDIPGHRLVDHFLSLKGPRVFIICTRVYTDYNSMESGTVGPAVGVYSGLEIFSGFRSSF